MPLLLVEAVSVAAREMKRVDGVLVLPRKTWGLPPSVRLSRSMMPERLSEVVVPPVPMLTIRATTVQFPLMACCRNRN